MVYLKNLVASEVKMIRQEDLMNPISKIDTLIIDTLTDKLNDLIGCCMDKDGNPIAPTKKDIMKYRALLPKRCEHTLIRDKSAS